MMNNEGSHQSGNMVPLLIGVFSFLVLALIPLKVISYGFLPLDDAMRHAAKVISGSPWTEILLIREGFVLDQHFGWHAFLGWVHSALGLEVDGLVALSVVALFLLFTLSGWIWVQRKEVWIASLLIASLLAGDVLNRLTLGRPLLVTMSVLVSILFIWGRNKDSLPKPPLMILTYLLLTLSGWMHGSWYLFLLPISCFVFSRWWTHAFRLSVCWVAGTLTASLLTGTPVAYITGQIHHLILSMSSASHTSLLVSEFQPFYGLYPFVIAVILLLLTRRVLIGVERSTVDQPVFYLLVIGWMLAFRVGRFWTDWALPAFLVWSTFMLSDIAASTMKMHSLRRLILFVFVSITLFLSSTSDLNGRWTHNLRRVYLSDEDPSLEGWMPEPGGIVYNTNIQIFYETFFANPHGEWRYAAGYEPTLMPEEDLNIYHNIHWNKHYPVALTPWIEKMKPADRMMIRAQDMPTVDLSRLEWLRTDAAIWIGRLPRTSP